MSAEQWFYLPQDWSVLAATGPEAATFLNGFCTNDVVRLDEGESCEAFFTNVKARILAYAWIARCSEESYRVVLSSPAADKLHEHLDTYLLSAKVELTVDQNTQLMIFGDEPTGLNHLACYPISSFGSYIKLAFDDPGATSVHTESLLKSGWRELAEEEFDYERISLGVPKDRVDVDERNLPQEVDRDDLAISFDKGCYLGQEPVARIDAMGHVNWLLQGLRLSSHEVQPGDELFRDEKCIGRVTSVAADGEGAIALGYVRQSFAKRGEQLVHAQGEAVVCETPFKP